MCKSNAVLGATPIIREVNKNDLNECLEESKEPYENVIKAVKNGGVFYYMQEL